VGDVVAVVGVRAHVHQHSRQMVQRVLDEQAGLRIRNDMFRIRLWIRLLRKFRIRRCWSPLERVARQTRPLFTFISVSDYTNVL
jgi:hypothetical protein